MVSDLNHMTGREQFVCVGVEESNRYDCSKGVPQGSVLGPILFSIYIRHIPSLLRPFIDHTILFADDVSFDLSRDSITDITTVMSNTDFKSAGSLVYRAQPQSQHGQDTLYANSPERNTVGTKGGHMQRTHLDTGAKHALSRSHH